jgi:hypothetical protein
MRGSIEEHIEAAVLEQYSLQVSYPEALEALERHLRICAACRDRLKRIEPFNMIHCTPDGPFYSRITQLKDGYFSAHHWGCQVDVWGRFRDLARARTYLIESFAQMFPKHECSNTCVWPRAPSR